MCMNERVNDHHERAFAFLASKEEGYFAISRAVARAAMA